MSNHSEKILAACADQGERDLIANICEALGYLVTARPDWKTALECVDNDSFAVLFLGSEFIDEDASEILGQFFRRDQDMAMIIIADEDQAIQAYGAIRQGAADFMTRPIDPRKLPIRLGVSIERRHVQIEERIYRLALEQRINERTEEVFTNRAKIRNQFIGITHALVRALQAKHQYTEGHSKRVAEVAVEIGRVMELPLSEIYNIELAALVHDVGKIGIRDEVLDKCGPLTDEEFDHVKLHTIIGADILAPVEEFRAIIPLVRHEHERFDGSGYPDGLTGKEIPLGARIIHVADVYDALVTDRSYRKGSTPQQAVLMIKALGGSQLCPECVAAFETWVKQRLDDETRRTAEFRAQA